MISRQYHAAPLLLRSATNPACDDRIFSIKGLRYRVALCIQDKHLLPPEHWGMSKWPIPKQHNLVEVTCFPSYNMSMTYFLIAMA